MKIGIEDDDRDEWWQTCVAVWALMACKSEKEEYSNL